MNVKEQKDIPLRAIAKGVLFAALISIGLYPSVSLAQPAQVASSSTQSSKYRPSAEEEKLLSFVKAVVASNEDVWKRLFTEQGKSYRDPQLVLYSGQAFSICGMVRAELGPTYCPGDRKLYLDLSYLGRMEQQLRSDVSFKKAGDFALAYIVSHEFGHHIQNLLGISDWLNMQHRQMDARSFNRLQVRFELQADYLAGIWAHYAEKWFPGLWESRDIEDALKAANVGGDDRIQGQLQGQVRPDTFTQGTSEQRMRWFYKGYSSGDLGGGNTFQVPDSQL
ncbi:MAG: neutral zinc metallopeptidase [Deltaproteobacteria bacterium]|nr:neutral zinc metallopeptidase [Deltaproteobacteria bacterium]